MQWDSDRWWEWAKRLSAAWTVLGILSLVVSWLVGVVTVALRYPDMSTIAIAFFAVLPMYVVVLVAAASKAMFRSYIRRRTAVSPQAFFTGSWRLDGNPSTVLELREDGTAKRRHEHGPTIQDGAWTYREGEAWIEWTPGAMGLAATDILKPDGGRALLGTCIGDWRPQRWRRAVRFAQEPGGE